MQLFHPYDLFRPYRHLGAYTATLDQQIAQIMRQPGRAWYDPSDMATLFQDSAGTTPVTAVEQPVGRMLDKSGNGYHMVQSTSTARPMLSARVNEVNNTEDATKWTGYGTVHTVASAIGGATLLHQLDGSEALPGASSSYPAGVFSPGVDLAIYRSIDIKNAGARFVRYGGSGAESAVVVDLETGSVIQYRYGTSLTAPPGTLTAMEDGWFRLQFWCSFATNWSASMLSLGVLAGRAWSGSMPTDTIDAEVWVRNIQYVLSDTVASVTDPVPRYQRVGDIATNPADYDTVGFPRYLRYDGVDDEMVATTPDASSGYLAAAGARRPTIAGTPLAGDGRGLFGHQAASLYLNHYSANQTAYSDSVGTRYVSVASGPWRRTGSPVVASLSFASGPMSDGIGWCDQSSVVASPRAATQIAPSTRLSLGGINRASSPLLGAIHAAVAWFGSRPSVAEDALIRQYLASKQMRSLP